MPAHIRLQDVINISTSQAQEREYAVDVGMYNYVAVQVRVVKAALGGTVQLEEAAVNEESAYVPVGTPVNLNAIAAPPKQVLTSPLRFLRWRSSGVNGDATFLIDLVARE
jgi:hypothetical protein